MTKNDFLFWVANKKTGAEIILKSSDNNAGLSTSNFKMLIKYFGNIFWLKKILFNIVEGNLFPSTY